MGDLSTLYWDRILLAVGVIGAVGWLFFRSKRKDLWVLVCGLCMFVVVTLGFLAMKNHYGKDYPLLFVAWFLIAVVTGVLMYIARSVQKKD